MYKKKRILFASEASYLFSGFGTYTRELMTRWYQTDKYILAEHANYAIVNDPQNRDHNIPWLFYPNAVSKEDSRFTEYKSNAANQFGLWRQEPVLLDFKPDITVSLVDPWMETLIDAPFYEYHHHVVMPTIDSLPYKEEWVEMYMKADAVYGYTNWGLNALYDQSNSKLKKRKGMYSGVNLNVFKPVSNKKAHKRKMGLSEDWFIVGTVMRNQKRKLYPELFQAFRIFLNNAPKELSDKTYLYCHVSYPDVGWNIPEALREFDIAHKVLFTYICRASNKPYIALFQDARNFSPYSQNITGVLPSVGKGLSEQQMAAVFNCFDLYVQYSISEGLGMPLVESSACGIPAAAVDATGMLDVIRLVKGYPIKIQKEYRELETNAYRVYPDNNDCARIFEEFLSLSEEERKRKSEFSRSVAKQYFNWDSIAKEFENYFDNAQLTGNQGKWDVPLPELPSIPDKYPENISNFEFIYWIYNDMIKQPHKLFSVKALEILRDLNYGATRHGNELAELDRGRIFNYFVSKLKEKISCEYARVGKIQPIQHDYIRYAHERIRNG